MENRRVDRAIESIKIYIATAFFDDRDKTRFVDALTNAKTRIEQELNERRMEK